MRNLLGVLLLAFFLCPKLFAEPSYITFPSDIPWKVKETEHFQILFREGQENFAERTLVAGERAYRLLSPIFPEAPTKTWVVLADFQDSLNGYALNFPYSHIVLFASPPEASGQLASLDDWLSSVMLHEFTHIVHLYPAHGLWKPMRTIFGSWVVPNGMMPSHLHEGMATFMETHFSRGGRGRSTAFNMFLRKAVESGEWGKSFAPLDLLDGSVIRWPFGAAPYFFGYYLYEDLWKRKGAKGFTELTQSYSSNWPYLIHGPAKEVYGANYDDLWEKIYGKHQAAATQEIADIKKNPVSELTYLTETRFNKWDLAVSPDGNRAVYRSHRPDAIDAFEIIDLKAKKVDSVLKAEPSSAEGMCWGKTPLGERIVYVGVRGRNHYLLNTLYYYDLKTDDSVPFELNEKSIEHVHAISCTADLSKIVAYSEIGGKGRVLELKWNGKDEKIELVREWAIPQASWVNGLLATDSLSWIALRQDVSTSLYQWPADKDPVLKSKMDFNVAQLQAGDNSDTLLALADKDSRREVWELSPSKGEMRKRVAVTGGLGGFALSHGKYWVLSYEHGGYDLAEAKPVSLRPQNYSAPSPNEVAKESPPTISATENYSPIGTLLPRTWIPSVLFVPDGVQAGAWIPGFDISQRHFYELFGGYDSRGLPFASFNYVYRFAGTYSWDISPYYFPSYLVSSKIFVKRWGGQTGLTWSSDVLGPYFPLTLRAAAIYKKVDYQVLGPTDSAGIQVSASTRIGFPRRPLSISPVNGVKLSVTHERYFKKLGSTRDYYSLVAAIDQYWEAPWWDKSVFFIGARSGFTEGTRFIDSYYESGGELLFYQARGTFINRGFIPGTFFGRRLLNVNAEYRFPIARVERGYGLSPVFLRMVHAALVADTTSTDRNPDTGLQQKVLSKWYTSAGVELRTDWKFFYYLPSQIRVGVYHGFGDIAGAKNVYATLGVEAGL